MTEEEQGAIVNSNEEVASREAPLRPYSGAWTTEEKRYATALIQEFRDGNIPGLPDKTTMRGYLAEKLGCPTKRISKKYEGTGYNGRLPYVKEVVALDPEEAKRRQKLLLELEEDFRKSRTAIVESRETSPVKRVQKSSGKPKKKKKPTLASATLANHPQRAAAATKNEHRVALNVPSAETTVPTTNPNNLLGTTALPTTVTNPSQDLMLEAMIFERSRIAAGFPSTADLFLGRRASLLNPLQYYGQAGLMGASSGLSLQAAALGNQLGPFFPSGGTGLGLSMTGVPLSSSLGTSGLYYGGPAAEMFGSQMPGASAALQSHFLQGRRHPSAEEEAFLEEMRRKRDWSETQAMREQMSSMQGAPETKKQRGA